MEFDPTSTAVVVVDMQNDFCHPDGALYAEGSEQVIPKVNEVIESVPGAVWYTQDTHHDGDPEFEQWGEHCLAGTWGHQLHDNLSMSRGAKTIMKGTYDAFHETTFDGILSDADIDTLVICGTLANVCVQETASSAALHGYDVYVVEDAVGYISTEQRDAALDHIDFLIGEVISTEDL